MRGLFFNAQPTTDITSHPSGFDREYDAEDFNSFMGIFFTDGVFVRADPDACKVIVTTGAKPPSNGILFRPGVVFVDGGQCHIEGTDRVVVSPISTTITTWTSIMCRRNNSADVRGFELLAVGALDDYPAPIRDGDIYDMCLAHLDVEPDGMISWVEDMRNDSDVCGFAALTGQPPYYPPDEANLPYIMWLYTLGFPMTDQQKAAVEGNPSLMAIYSNKSFYDKKETVGLASGSCATAAATAAKTAAVTNFNLISGACLALKFTYTNTAASPTLNVNSTGAKPIYNYNTGTYITSGDIVAGMTAYLTYNGTQWVLLNPAKKIATGTYTGTGTYGSGNPNTLTLNFVPQLLVIQARGSFGSSTGYVWLNGSTSVTSWATIGTSSSMGYATVTWSGNTVSWYSTRDVTSQLNDSGTVFAYMAFG